MAKIKQVISREILDSRGNPTIETKVVLEDGAQAVSSVPSGASKGKFEALELKDNDPFRYRGQGVLKAVDNVNNVLGPIIAGTEAGEQERIDRLLIEADNTPNKAKLGANAILSLSQAVFEAQAVSLNLANYQYVREIFIQKNQLNKGFVIPRPLFNLINGGKHGAGNNLDFQEFHITPSQKIPFYDSLMIADSIYKKIGQTLQQENNVFSLGDEGGYAPNFKSNKQAIEFLIKAGEDAGFEHVEEFKIALDLAANSFLTDKGYVISDFKHPLTAQEIAEFYLQLFKDYSIFSFEDPFAEEDWSSFKEFTAKASGFFVIGDDLLCTNTQRIQRAIEEKACSVVLIKPNQVGTISETFEAIALAQKTGLKIIVSHRSGETNEDFIADLAVGVSAEMVKFGAPARGERVAKYNRLLEIEKEIGNKLEI